jgi:hypothetical protein
MGTADVARGLPHLALRPFVKQYVGYRMEGYPPACTAACRPPT